MSTRTWLAAAGLLLLTIAPVSAQAPDRWQTLPPTPAAIPAAQSGTLTVNGAALAYSVYGQGSPVILLHGGFANANYFGNQVRVLAEKHRVVLLDTRGHGRSSNDGRPLGYDLLSDDVVALLDHLNIARADVVGWSDGAIVGLDLAMNHPDRVGKVFAFAANSRPDGVIPDVDKNPVFAAFIARSEGEIATLSKDPKKHAALQEQLFAMWAREPNWTDAQLQAITVKVLVADGDHDEAIKREHTEYLARTIPHAGLLILPNASHFAFLQDPALFNAAMLDFLDDQ